MKHSEQRLKDAEWQDTICARDKNRCQICLRVYPRNSVCAHHYHTKAAHPDLRHDLKNGLCVCLSCHTKIHASKIPKEKILERLKQIIHV